MLALALAAALQLYAPQAGPVDVVRAYHGTRLELVFTTPVVVSVKLAPVPSVWDVRGTAERGDCEWFGPRLDGTRVEVCRGEVTRIALGSDVRTVTR